MHPLLGVAFLDLVGLGRDSRLLCRRTHLNCTLWPDLHNPYKFKTDADRSEAALAIREEDVPTKQTYSKV